MKKFIQFIALLGVCSTAFSQGGQHILSDSKHLAGDPATHPMVTSTALDDEEGNKKRALDISIREADNVFSYAAYGEQAVISHIPVVQGQAYYRFIPSNFRSFTGGSGSTSASEGYLEVNSGTTLFGYGTIQSFRSMNYSAGNGAVIRFAQRPKQETLEHTPTLNP